MGGSLTIEGGTKIEAEVRRMLTDYVIQGQVMTTVMGFVDEEDGWDGPKYVAEHVRVYVGSQLIHGIIGWDGQKARWRARSRNRQGRSSRRACRRVWV